MMSSWQVPGCACCYPIGLQALPVASSDNRSILLGAGLHVLCVLQSPQGLTFPGLYNVTHRPATDTGYWPCRHGMCRKRCRLTQTRQVFGGACRRLQSAPVGHSNSRPA